MLKAVKKMSPIKRFLKQQKATAAVEFALIAPVLAALVFGISEVMFRFQVTDEFSRYAFQSADLITREKNIDDAFFQEILDTSDLVLNGSFVKISTTMEVVSIGFEADNGDPVFLWKKSNLSSGNGIALSEAAGLGSKLETVVGVKVNLVADTPITYFAHDKQMNLEKTIFFRPRTSRLITYNNVEAVTNTDWEETS